MFAVQFPQHLPIPAILLNSFQSRTFTTSFECGVPRTWSASPCHCGCAYLYVMPGCPMVAPSQDASDHQDDITFLIGNPGIPIHLHLPLASCEGATSNFASSSILIDPSNVRSILSAAEIVSFVWTAYLSFARGANK